jgi:hypothetical protein
MERLSAFHALCVRFRIDARHEIGFSGGMKTLLLIVLLLVGTLGRAGDPAERAAWLEALNASINRVKVKYPTAAAYPEFWELLSARQDEWLEAGDERAERSDSPELAAVEVVPEFAALLEKRAARKAARAAQAARLRPAPVYPQPSSRWTPPKRSTAGSGTIQLPGGQGIRNYWTNPDGSVQMQTPQGIVTIYPE